MINTELSYEAAAHSSYSQFTSNIMASSPVVTTVGSTVVVTHVIPTPQVAVPQNAAEKNKLRRGCLVALGTAQIVIGLMVFLFELAMIQCKDTLGIFSGASIWGPLCSILSGSLTVAAEAHNYLVKGALGYSVVAAVSSGAATVIYCLDVFSETLNLPVYHCRSDSCNSVRNSIRTDGVSGVLTGVSTVEFIISVCVFLFLYEASRLSTDQQPIVITNQSHETAAQTPETLPTYEPLPITQPPPTSEGGYETMRPVEYDTTIIYQTTPPLTNPTSSNGSHVLHLNPPPVLDPTSSNGSHVLHLNPPPVLDPTSSNEPHVLHLNPPPVLDPTSSNEPHVLHLTPPPVLDPTSSNEPHVLHLTPPSSPFYASSV